MLGWNDVSVGKPKEKGSVAGLGHSCGNLPAQSPPLCICRNLGAKHAAGSSLLLPTGAVCFVSQWDAVGTCWYQRVKECFWLLFRSDFRHRKLSVWEVAGVPLQHLSGNPLPLHQMVGIDEGSAAVCVQFTVTASRCLRRWLLFLAGAVFWCDWNLL